MPVVGAEGGAEQSCRFIQRIVLLDLVRRPPLDPAAQAALQIEGAPGGGQVLFAHQEQVALAVKINPGRPVLNRHLLLEALQHLKRVLGDLDVLLEAELDADVAHGKGGRGAGIGGIAFHHRDLERRVGFRQVIGRGAAHDAAAGDDHVVGLGVFHLAQAPR